MKTGSDLEVHEECGTSVITDPVVMGISSDQTPETQQEQASQTKCKDICIRSEEASSNSRANESCTFQRREKEGT